MNERVKNLIERLKETAHEFDTETDDFTSLYEIIAYRPTLDKSFFWAYGGDILSTSEENINALADYYEEQYNATPLTGYYDPIEDKKDENVDEFSGNYYLYFY